MNAYDPGTQPDFYAQLAAESDVSRIVDLGCGTGIITRDLARRGYEVIGVDPAPAMIDRARNAPGGDRVQWICGEAAEVGTPDADLAIMSGHVAQFFVADESWAAALRALHDALRPGGGIAFETRNPDAREWEQWTRDTRMWVDDPVAGRVETWVEVEGVRDGVVECTNHYRFATTGDELLSPTALRFRSVDQLRESLATAGFAIVHLFGDWDRRAAGPSERELIVVAERP